MRIYKAKLYHENKLVYSHWVGYENLLETLQDAKKLLTIQGFAVCTKTLTINGKSPKILLEEFSR